MRERQGQYEDGWGGAGGPETQLTVGSRSGTQRTGDGRGGRPGPFRAHPAAQGCSPSPMAHWGLGRSRPANAPAASHRAGIRAELQRQGLGGGLRADNKGLYPSVHGNHVNIHSPFIQGPVLTSVLAPDTTVSPKLAEWLAIGPWGSAAGLQGRTVTMWPKGSGGPTCHLPSQGRWTELGAEGLYYTGAAHPPSGAMETPRTQAKPLAGCFLSGCQPSRVTNFRKFKRKKLKQIQP